MGIPRQTVWASKDEFIAVYTLLYKSDAESISKGVTRVNTWLSRGSCPQAVESTAALLQASLSDQLYGNELTARLSYSMALTRFVNSVVDPMQRGYFAKSIATIALQVGLPLWFVELRHAATHDHLPPLALLRLRASEALGWLRTHYWEGMLGSLAGDATAALVAGLDLAALRQQLVLHLKHETLVATDASRIPELAPDRTKNTRLILDWIRSAASLSSGRTQDVLNLVSDVLMEPGVLLSKRKRTGPLPTEAWMPLLTQIDDEFTGFLDTLMQSMLDVILMGDSNPELEEWCIYFASESDYLDQLVKSCLFSGSQIALSFLDQLIQDNPSLQNKAEPLLDAVRIQTNGNDAEDMASMLDSLEQRLNNFVPKSAKKEAKPKGNIQFCRAQDWIPCPLGTVLGHGDLSLKKVVIEDSLGE